MATTTRLPEPLRIEASAYAASLGVSLNALMAVALRDYLDQRKRGGASAVASAEVPSRTSRGAVRQAASGPARRAPCPCGSGRQYRHCCERKAA